MKYLRMFEGFQSESEVAEICDKYFIENWSINSEGLVDVNGRQFEVHLYLYNKGLTKLPLKFGTVTGDFDCSSNQLTSLEGAPKSVGGYFICDHNQLTSLEGSTQTVGGSFDCGYNQLTSLYGAPEKVGRVFNCRNNQIKSFEGAPRSIGGKFYCESNPIHSVWKLISPDNTWDEGIMELFTDYDCLRDDDIIIDRFNDFLKQIGKPEVDSVEGYNNI